MNQAGAANVDVIRRNAARGEAAAPEGEKEPLRLVIREFSLTRGKIDADTTAVGGKEVEVKLPPLALRNIGGSRGAAPDEIGKIMVRALTGQVATAVAAQRLGSYLEKKIDEKLEGEAGEAAKDLLRSITR